MSDLPDLHSSLLNIDLAVVKIIARFWRMDVPVGITIQELASKLSYHMSTPDVGEVVWGNLT
ncbi:MAG TPA: hypothetical protein PLZ51_26390, partial [Aggregatilineales bacterium]|nr:hypothetical protein [Aggregatilineales bacterium]